MNDASMRSVGPSDEAEARLATLNGQVSAMRAVLVQLLQEVVVAEARLDHGEASLLLKANEQLIVSALAAQTDADSAHGALNAFADAAMHFAKKQALGAAAPDPEPQHVEPAQRQTDLRDANESLILAALGAQDLLAAAAEVRRRQTGLLALIANELSDPYAPIRLAASTLGIPGAEATLLPRVQVVIDEQAERLARMVREVLRQQGSETD